MVVVDDRLGEVVPAAAVPAMRAAAAVYAGEGLSQATRTALASSVPPPVAELVARAIREPLVLVAPERDSPEADALVAAGARVIEAPPPAGVELLDAVAVMDRLRSPGGCPWDAKQDHDSLRKYLVEETYELLDAIEQRDREALREELGDVLLQVLFHARVAVEDEAAPFGVDEVAAGLVGKLVSRHPHVFSDGENLADSQNVADSQKLPDSESQQLRWEELKQREKRRESIVDGVALGQPAVALAAKLAQRAQNSGVPSDLLPRGASTGRTLFDVAARAMREREDPEDALRAVAVGFAAQVRATEALARQAGHEPGSLSGEQWRQYWMSALSGPVANRPQS